MAGRIIDGNQIVNDNLARKAQPGQYGMVNDARTGKVLAEIALQGAPDMGRSAFQPSMQDVGLLEEQNKQERLAQAELETIRDKEQYEGGMSMDPEFTDSELTDEFEARRQEYLYDAGHISNYREKIGQSNDDMWNGMGGDFTDKDMSLFLDARNIKTEEDAIRLGEINDRWMDFSGVDAEKYYQEGVMEECGPECQERRASYAQNAEELYAKMISKGDQPMAMSDEEFENRTKNLNL